MKEPIVKTSDSPAKDQPWMVPGLGMKFVYVAPGSFQMGSNDFDSSENETFVNKVILDCEKPMHEVTITEGYWIGKYLVTQEEYQKIIGNNPSHFTSGKKIGGFLGIGGKYLSDDTSRYPVETVNWEDAVEYCEKLTARERAAGRLPSGYEYCLPTEAEWEFAACGGTKSRGYKYSGSDSIDRVALYSSNSGKKTHEVGTRLGNELGIHDMSGNLYEWCHDRFGRYNSGRQTDPTGTREFLTQVKRGGSWESPAINCRSACRGCYRPSVRYSDVGFRVAMATPVKK